MTAASRPLVVTGISLWQWLLLAREAAIQADVPPTEVDWLLEEFAALDRLALRLESFKSWPEIRLAIPLEDLDKLWQQRLKDRLPVQYIAGVTYWRHFKLTVSPGVLIPRPETETLIDLAVTAVQKSLADGKGKVTSLANQGQWADLGTGSGAIAIGLAAAFPSASIHAVDSSPVALSIAQFNAQNLGFANRIHFYQGSWWEPLELLKGQLSGIVSNPPYIPSAMVPQLPPEVARHEPLLALDGGPDGLDAIRQLIETSPTYLKPGGVWLIEMMAGQSDTVATLLHSHSSYCNIEIHSDLAGIERFALACRV